MSENTEVNLEDRKRKLDEHEIDNKEQEEKKLKTEGVETQNENGDKGEIKHEIEEEQGDQNGNADKKEENEKDDELGYSKRGDFTSEVYKIIVKGLPKYFGIKEIKKHFEAATNVKICKLIPTGGRGGWRNNHKNQKNKNQPGVFVTFYNEEQRQIALDKLNNFTYKGNKLYAAMANAQPDPYIVKQKEIQKQMTEEEIQQLIDNCNEEKLKDTTIPLWNVAYEKQLEIKMETMKTDIDKMVADIEKLQPNLKKWFDQQREKYNGVPVELTDIRQCTQPEGYRNKCEFSIGLNPKTKEKTVGFRYGKYSDGFVFVGPVDNLIHIPDKMKQAVSIFQKYIRQSPLDIFDIVQQTGYWRMMMCRYSKCNDQLMVLIGFDPQDLKENEIADVKEQLKQYFDQSDEGKLLNCTSLQFRVMPRRLPRGVPHPPAEVLSGSPTITQKLFDLSFNISPVSFFQINTESCHNLYNAVAELANLDKETSLLDICSGVGTIGLCLANRCGEVLGVEVNKNAVEDAKINATNNNITNCEYFAGKAEDLTSHLISRAKFTKIAAVVDPPRAGIHQRLSTYIRTSKLDNLIYMACDTKSVMDNFNGLCNPESKKFKKSPFIPTKIIPVDMFPYTNQLEWVVLLQRYDSLNKE